VSPPDVTAVTEKLLAVSPIHPVGDASSPCTRCGRLDLDDGIGDAAAGSG